VTPSKNENAQLLAAFLNEFRRGSRALENPLNRTVKIKRDRNLGQALIVIGLASCFHSKIGNKSSGEPKTQLKRNEPFIMSLH